MHWNKTGEEDYYGEYTTVLLDIGLLEVAYLDKRILLQNDQREMLKVRFELSKTNFEYAEKTAAIAFYHTIRNPDKFGNFHHDLAKKMFVEPFYVYGEKKFAPNRSVFITPYKYDF